VNVQLAAYDLIANCLAVRNPRRTDDALARALTSEDLDWCTVIGVADAHFVTPALWVALRDKVLAENLPSHVRDYLQELHRLNTLRNRHLRAQLAEAVRRLNAVGIVPILLKGTASFYTKTFEDPGSRVMADVDILVPTKDATDCWNALRGLGYEPVANMARGAVGELPPLNYDDHHHLRPLHRPGDYGVIEIHRHVVPASLQRLLPTGFFWKAARFIEVSGAKMAVPTPTCQVLHNLLHSALADRAYTRGSMPLRSLHELALMQMRYGSSIDWELIEEQMALGHRSKVLHAWTYLVHRLFGNPLPLGAGSTPRALVHYGRVRLQVRLTWMDWIVQRALWFSVDDICDRFRCKNDIVSVTKGRVRLAADLVARSLGKASLWITRRLRFGKA